MPRPLGLASPLGRPRARPLARPRPAVPRAAGSRDCLVDAEGAAALGFVVVAGGLSTNDVPVVLEWVSAHGLSGLRCSFAH